MFLPPSPSLKLIMDWVSENIFTEIVLWFMVAMGKTAVHLVHT